MAIYGINPKTAKEPPSKPFIIAIEGIDGAGKNTYAQKLAALLNAQVVSFPQYGVTSAAELIECGLRDAEKYSPWHMAQLFAADRKESAHLLRGTGVIIVDRYVASNAAYLHAKTGYHDAYDAMETLEYDTLGLPRPDLQIFVDTPVSVAGDRIDERGREKDSFEKDRELQVRVRESYLRLVDEQWLSPWVVVSSGVVVDYSDAPYVADPLEDELWEEYFCSRKFRRLDDENAYEEETTYLTGGK